jgi:hypothetical protein
MAMSEMVITLNLEEELDKINDAKEKSYDPLGSDAES